MFDIRFQKGKTYTKKVEGNNQIRHSEIAPSNPGKLQNGHDKIVKRKGGHTAHHVALKPTYDQT